MPRLNSNISEEAYKHARIEAAKADLTLTQFVEQAILNHGKPTTQTTQADDGFREIVTHWCEYAGCHSPETNQYKTEYEIEGMSEMKVGWICDNHVKQLIRNGVRIEEVNE